MLIWWSRETKTQDFTYSLGNGENASCKTSGSRSNVEDDINVWHKRLIHANFKPQKPLENHAIGFPKLRGNLQVCHPCRLGKAKKKCFGSHFEATEYASEVVHSDLAVEMPLSIDGRKYLCTFTD